MASLTQWTWVWVRSRSWWWTGRPGVLQCMGSQRVRNDWATELNWICKNTELLCYTLETNIILQINYIPILKKQHGSGENSWTLQSRMIVSNVKRARYVTVIIQENKRCLLVLIFLFSLPKYFMNNYFKHLYFPPLLYIIFVKENCFQWHYALLCLCLACPYTLVRRERLD